MVGVYRTTGEARQSVSEVSHDYKSVQSLDQMSPSIMEEIQRVAILPARAGNKAEIEGKHVSGGQHRFQTKEAAGGIVTVFVATVLGCFDDDLNTIRFGIEGV
jgi:hypothetical protein